MQKSSGDVQIHLESECNYNIGDCNTFEKFYP